MKGKSNLSPSWNTEDTLTTLFYSKSRINLTPKAIPSSTQHVSDLGILCTCLQLAQCRTKQSTGWYCFTIPNIYSFDLLLKMFMAWYFCDGICHLPTDVYILHTCSPGLLLWRGVPNGFDHCIITTYDERTVINEWERLDLDTTPRAS